MSNKLPGSQDTKFFNQHRNEYIRLPEPSLPNGQRPDFGNGSNGRRHNNSKKHQQPQPSSQPSSTPSNQKNNKSYTKNKQNNTPRNKGNNSSPLSSPKLSQQQPNKSNYRLSSPPSSAPGSFKDITKPKRSENSINPSSSSSSSSYAGSTFNINAPESKSLPKPAFL
ncbi:hypothetical protein WICMUC_001949 [Wickerhamomyces mucosus]|uniref:Enhancer of mRNA-decapping protein 1 n=1 Tax=Wickerhamomyces mucosus TaxID=1378264 RepID=A0A9P8TEW7_9ASCO|nr:hypothetical protein WICMUC_001949 [Wickerhamomyces mucosus]